MNKKIFRFRKKGLLFYFLLLALLTYFILADGAGFFRKLGIKLKISRIKDEIETLEKDNERIAKENEDLEKNPTTWEKKARELGMQKEGEEVYMFKESEQE
ncbi:MAG: septum formation initiator family protein [Candidatus Cloacimonetes bacterium]|nr:septum formation initiator family protein [Candidatus Cloacimonadota bacterium]